MMGRSIVLEECGLSPRRFELKYEVAWFLFGNLPGEVAQDCRWSHRSCLDEGMALVVSDCCCCMKYLELPKRIKNLIIN